MKSLGLYLHIPFCRSKCHYCDFCSLPRPDEGLVQDYVAALARDLCHRAPEAREYEVNTVYIGGGTPTYLSGETLASLLEMVKKNYLLTPDAEISVECNPATADREKLSIMRQAGANRLSVGLQSIHKEELRALGRIHTVEDVERILADARSVGFENLSADVMSGIPHQTVESYLATLAWLTQRDVSHISSYGLIIEEGTPFAAREEELPLPDEETARQMYLAGAELLESRGYAQYEISNFARPGRASRHNLRYWNAEEFLGFGPAAYSDFGGARFGYVRDLVAYIEGREAFESFERPSSDERREEYVMLRLRLAEGIDLSKVEERFGTSAAATYAERLSRYLPLRLVRRTPKGFALTREGMYVSNAILSEVLDL